MSCSFPITIVKHAHRFCCVLAFLINKLEEVCWQESQQGRQDAGRGWVVHTLRAVSVQYSPMFRAYNEMFDAKVSASSHSSRMNHKLIIHWHTATAMVITPSTNVPP